MYIYYINIFSNTALWPSNSYNVEWIRESELALRICRGCDNHKYSTLDSITEYIVSTKYKQNKHYNTIV